MRLIICLLIILSFKGYSQDRHIEGITIDTITSQVVKKATIAIYSNGVKSGEYLTDINGHFKIPEGLFFSGDLLEIIADGYNDLVYDKKKIKELKKKNVFQFILSPKGISLREVVIKNRKRYRDTLSIDLSNEKYEKNLMINDLLSGSKGFSKDINGKLFYKGKEVSDVQLNNGDFFGKNNLDIYKYLPALILSDIQIVETDIDSLTNTNLITPKIKVNLRLKSEFKNGKFGGLNAGYGNKGRYLLATDLYQYKNNEQVSLVLNSNNISAGDNQYIEPSVGAPSVGNQILSNSAKLTYRNILLRNKIEVEGAIKLKRADQNMSSESLRQETNFNQLSHTTNSSSSKLFGIEEANLNVSYSIDSLTSLTAKHIFSYNRNQQNDSISYSIKNDSKESSSQLIKNRIDDETSLVTQIQFQRRSSSKKGRFLDFYFNSDYKKFYKKELNSIFSLSNSSRDDYFINGNRRATQKKVSGTASLTEPLNEKGYLQAILSFNNDVINYDANVVSDSLLSYLNDPSGINNRYLTTGAKFHYTFEKIDIGSSINGVANFRDIDDNSSLEQSNLFFINMNFAGIYKLNSRKKLSLNYSRDTNYPTIGQLTMINNSFDLISQMDANIYLRPEIKKRTEFIYENRSSDSLNFQISGGITSYKSKFGYFTINSSGSYQISYIDNIGTTNSFDLNFLIGKFLIGRMWNYRVGLNYDNNPTVLNYVRVANKGMRVNQNLSTDIAILRMLHLYPTLSVNYSEYSYSDNKINVFDLTYSDKISIKFSKNLSLTAYPIFNYSRNIDKRTTWALNAECRYDFSKSQASIWLKGYDLFDSFKYNNNYLGASYTQSVTYSNLNRYIVGGFSIKFNNMK